MAFILHLYCQPLSNMRNSILFLFISLYSITVSAQQKAISLSEWKDRVKIMSLFPEIDSNIVFYAAYGHAENWLDLSEVQAVRYGLNINDSVDERRHPYLAALAFERMLNSGGCKAPSAEPLDPSYKAAFFDQTFDDGHWQPVEINGPIDLKQMATHSNAASITWKRANPHLLFRILPSTNTRLFIPSYEMAIFDSLSTLAKEDFIASQKKVDKPTDFKEVVVRQGESLSVIAEREKVRVNDIIRWNKLRSDRIYVGQKLIISVPKGQTTQAPPKSTETKPINIDNAIPYTVQEGESLWIIAQKFPGVTPEDIISHNHLTGTVIDVGQVLYIPQKKP